MQCDAGGPFQWRGKRGAESLRSWHHRTLSTFISMHSYSRAASQTIRSVHTSPVTHDPRAAVRFSRSGCAPGYFQNFTGKTECMICPPGFWCTAEEAVPCTKDTFNPEEGQTSQLSCRSCGPLGTTAELEGRTSSRDCMYVARSRTPDPGRLAIRHVALVSSCSPIALMIELRLIRCRRGYYNPSPSIVSNGTECAECPSGTDCADAGATIDSLPIRRGYYRLDASSADVRRCPDAAANCTDEAECRESTSGCRGTVVEADEQSMGTAPEICAVGLTGVFCRLCDRSHFNHSVYYSPASTSLVARCANCRDTARDGLLLLFGLLLALVLGFAVILAIYHSVSLQLRQTLSHAWHRFTPHNKLKIIIGFYMIATKVDDVYEVELPPQVRSLLSVFSVAISFGMTSASSVLECLGFRGFLSTLLLYMVTPAALAALVVLFFFATLPCQLDPTPTTLFLNALPALLRISFLACVQSGLDL